MNQALAHDHLYPHHHPHPQVSITWDVLSTLLYFFLVVIAIYSIYILNQYLRKKSKEKDRRSKAMHEHSLMINLVKKIETLASEQNASKVTGVKVMLGAFSHFSPTHFIEHFDQVTPGTICEGITPDVYLNPDESHPQACEVILESLEFETRS